MSKVTFEDFLMEKHAEDYIGTKDCMVDASADWIANLSPDEFIEYGDMFAKEQSKGLLEYSKKVMALLEKNGGSIVPHLLDTDENDGEFLRQAIAKMEGK